jgi:GMP synthase-like glutamine amidotransferase/tetratricopeptide (TPR) repeat protein
VRALALEHLRADPVGIFGDVLVERGIEVDAVRLEQGERLPDWRDYDLLVVMGGAMSVWEEDEYPWLVDEKRAIREAVLAGVPYFGVCLGSQLLASAFHARVYLGPEPELGANQMFLTAAARHDPVFRGFPPDVEVFEFHLCHFDLPRGAIRLARSPRYQNQAIRYGRVAYAIQCHLEPSLEEIRAWFESSPHLLARFESRHGQGSVEAFFDEYAKFLPFLQRTGRQLFGRWLEHALALGGLRAAAHAVAAGPHHGRDLGDELVGRDRERMRIDALLDTAREGGSGVLVLRGDAGSGKTALLDDAVSRAGGLRVLRTAGRDGEIEVPFAALAELLRPLIGLLETMAPARAQPLAAALGRSDTPGQRDRFAAYAGALDVLTAAAENEPLLVVVDDGHRLDDASAEAIGFLAQRLGADGIALLIASEAADDLPEAEELALLGLEPAAARSLLEARVGDALAPAVSERVLAAAQGNPLALLEIPPALTSAQRAGREPIDEALLTSAEWAFLARIGALPYPAQKALLVAALADDGDLAQVRGACATLGLDPSLLESAARAALVRLSGGKVSFRHPLVRTTVAYSALRADRRAVHTAIAAVAAGESRLWHRAHAAAGADAPIAAELEQAAEAARDRGAYGTMAHTLELAARLTPDTDEAARRLLLAAGAAHLAGHIHAALDHLNEALGRAEDSRLRVRIKHLYGRVTARSGSAVRARDTLASAAAACESDDPVQAADLLADAVLPSLRAGAPAEACELGRRAVGLAQGAGGRPEVAATLMLGTALVFAGDYAEGAALVDHAADLAEDGERADDRQLRSYLGAGLAISGRHERARKVLVTLVKELRADGTLALLPYALVRLAAVEIETGRWAAASGVLHEALRLAQETGQSADNGLALGTLAWLEAAQGRVDACRGHVEEALELADRLGSGSRLAGAAAAAGLLELGAGRPADAIPHLEDVRALQDEQGWSDAAVAPHVIPDLVEAYASAGRPGEAQAALAGFAAAAERTGRASALAAAARCRALLADRANAEGCFTEALRLAERVSNPFDRARTELLYGACHSAAGRPAEARAPLEAALVTFDRLGAAPWAERTREQLILAGVAAPERKRSPLDVLTPLELELALAVAGGSSAREAGRRLFVGPRTAQLRLASAVVKLGLDSPSELATLLRAETTVAIAG